MMTSSNVRGRTDLRFIKEITPWQEKLSIIVLIMIPLIIFISFENLTSMIDTIEFSTILLFVIGVCTLGLLLRLRTTDDSKVIYKFVYDKNNQHDQSRSWFEKNYIPRSDNYDQAMESFMTHLQSAIITHYRIPPTKLSDIHSLFHFKEDTLMMAKEPCLYEDIVKLEIGTYPTIEYILSDRIQISDDDMIKILDIATWKMYVLFETNEDVLSYVNMVLVDMLQSIDERHK